MASQKPLPCPLTVALGLEAVAGSLPAHTRRKLESDMLSPRLRVAVRRARTIAAECLLESDADADRVWRAETRAVLAAMLSAMEAAASKLALPSDPKSRARVERALNSKQETPE